MPEWFNGKRNFILKTGRNRRIGSGNMLCINFLSALKLSENKTHSHTRLVK